MAEDKSKESSADDEASAATRRGSPGRSSTAGGSSAKGQAARGPAAKDATSDESPTKGSSSRRPASAEARPAAGGPKGDGGSPIVESPSAAVDAASAGPTSSSGDQVGPAVVAGEAPVGLLSAMWRYKGMCVGIVVVCVLLSAGIGFLMTPEPSATATIALKTPSQDNVLAPGSTGDASLSRYTAQRARFVTSDAVLGNVGASLGVDDLNELRDQLEVQPSTDSNIITITASGTTSGDAVRLATEVTRSYAEETEKQVDELTDAALRSIDESAGQVRATITNNNVAVNDAAASTLGQLQQKAATIRTSSAVLGNGVEFVVNPDESSVVTQQLPIKEAALGLVLGLIIAGTVAYLRADSEAAKSRRA